MAVNGEWIEYGNQRGFFAWPGRASKPLPGVVVIQEIWGVDFHIEDVTRRIAAAGYAALAPDLFAVDKVRPAALGFEPIMRVQQFAASLPPGTMFNEEARKTALSTLPEDEAARIVETIQSAFQNATRVPEFIAPLRAAVRHLREDRPESKGQRVGCVGFCMGGSLSALLSCEEPELSAAAVFYGNAPAADLVPQTSCPVLGLYGGNDARVNAGVPAFRSAMEAARRPFETHVYEGANHAFFNDTGWGYDPDASRDAFVRLLQFFRHHLVT